MDNGVNGEEDVRPKPRLVRKGSLIAASVPGAPKMSQEELNEWIRKDREREI